MSVADIALYAYTHEADKGGFDLAAYPAINAWLARVEADPGHVPMKLAAGVADSPKNQKAGCDPAFRLHDRRSTLARSRQYIRDLPPAPGCRPERACLLG